MPVGHQPVHAEACRLEPQGAAVLGASLLARPGPPGSRHSFKQDSQARHTCAQAVYYMNRYAQGDRVIFGGQSLFLVLLDKSDRPMHARMSMMRVQVSTANEQFGDSAPSQGCWELCREWVERGRCQYW